jgi:hypothetical protein
MATVFDTAPGHLCAYSTRVSRTSPALPLCKAILKHTAQDSNLYAIRPYKELQRVSTRRQTTINVLQYGIVSTSLGTSPYASGFSRSTWSRHSLHPILRIRRAIERSSESFFFWTS